MLGTNNLKQAAGVEKNVNETQLRAALENCLSVQHHLLWFCSRLGIFVLNGQSATRAFFARASSSDISPFRFFDPEWFRSRYSVTGPNAFLSYLRNPKQRLAIPSPVFASRWYCRRYILNPAVHPFLDFLQRGDERDPHPLIDAKFLQSQNASWYRGATALQFLTDPDKYRLKPHPLFDGEWYLDNNPDVAAAGVNPLEHYLRYGHTENRNPNRIFNVRWYRETYLNLNRRVRLKVEPLTSYVIQGSAVGFQPAPGLDALAKPSIKKNSHGPQPYIDRMADGRSIYACLRHRPKLPYETFQRYMSGKVQDYNPALPEHILLLRKQRVAVMYTPKCASAKLVYWWQEQSDLLDSGLQFSDWSHSFENIYRTSQTWLADALTFDPVRYQVYKFVRDPRLRAVSGFTHFLSFPDSFGFSELQDGLSFIEYLDLMENTNYLNQEIHFRPQLTKLEKSGVLSPHIIKIEDGLEAHLRTIERLHGFRSSTFDKHETVVKSLASHAKQPRRNVFTGPETRVKFGKVPDARSLLTQQSTKIIYRLYRGDFQAYGY